MGLIKCKATISFNSILELKVFCPRLTLFSIVNEQRNRENMYFTLLKTNKNMQNQIAIW